MNKIKLEPLAALSIRMGEKAFSSDVVRSFIQHLDLSPGDPLCDTCNSICDWYREAVINGKYYFLRYLRNLLEKSDERHLIIILAAGKSPLSLELLNNNYNSIDRILEIDVSGVDEKKELYDRFYPQYSNKIKCITADISSKCILSLLKNLLEEYYNDLPCIIVLEGASYYLSVGDLENIVASFSSCNNRNKMLVEYLLSDEYISDDRKEIPKKIFSSITDISGIPGITRYGIKDLKELFEKTGGELIEVTNLQALEKERLGTNKYFSSPEDGWLEYSVWQI